MNNDNKFNVLYFNFLNKINKLKWFSLIRSLTFSDFNKHIKSIKKI